MLYPVYVHKDEGSAYGLTFPDFPGCFSAADELADLPRMAQEAVEVYFEGETFATPVPSTPEQWAGDERFQGGYWMLVDIDLAKICSAPVRLNISLPEYLVRQIDDYAKAHHQTRSGFLARAAEEAMRAR
ncbi:MAG: type II toxin-antitoxin system HicB family antitoxin [Rhodocyclaceae bacterium]